LEVINYIVACPDNGKTVVI